jgi:hypothetical protein
MASRRGRSLVADWQVYAVSFVNGSVFVSRSVSVSQSVFVGGSVFRLRCG